MSSRERGEPQSNDPTFRRIAQGTVSGLVSPNGALAWRGIPFAAPPVGALRWKAARPPAPFAEHFAAVSCGAACVQGPSLAAPFVDDDGDGLVGSEDCLYLNVFAPSQVTQPLPVMFWIHGGGNVGGHNASPGYDASLLAERHNVVVVAVNYRLGALGWFVHPAFIAEESSADDASGNWGILDIIRGLEWVRENIAAFGGDAGNVTVFGQSAGGLNACALLLSPRAAGLFHRAIVQSGGAPMSTFASATNFSDDPEPGHFNSAREVFNRLLIRLGRAPDREAAKALQQQLSAAEIRELLYAQTPAEIIALMNPHDVRLYDAPRVLLDGTVITREPAREAFAAGHFNKVPVILGTTRDERRLYMYRDPRFERMLESAPGDYMRYSLYTSLAWKLRGVDELARAMFGSGHRAIYAYRFDWDEQGIIDDVDLSLALGAAHTVELPFVFGHGTSLAAFGDLEAPSRHALTRSVQAYWAEFAYTGTPGAGRNGDELHWTAWDNAADASKLMIFDTDADGGIRLSAEQLTLEGLKHALLTDSGFHDRALQAQLYREVFGRRAFEREYPAATASPAAPAE
ncbi:MAG TPA: carboxylesterase family protein [Polyangiales bacterium]|nr:carboxylesterase family protein [Polyangiales bacterium]